MKRLGIVLGACALFAAGAAFYAQARTHTDASAGITGCLKLSGDDDGGQLTRLALGDSPARPCKKKEVVVHLGSGDISAVNAGTGLQGGASTGAATLAVAPSYRLPQGCTDPNIVPKFVNGAWACGQDQNTKYTGNDFALSGQACPGGEFANGISAVGALTCAKPGAAIVVTPLAAGDANCAAGGVSIQIGDQTSYVCNGAKGEQGIQGPAGSQGPAGPQGPEGPAGQSGTGSLFSPNGTNGITINNNGVFIHFKRGTQFYAFNGTGLSPNPFYGR